MVVIIYYTIPWALNMLQLFLLEKSIIKFIFWNMSKPQFVSRMKNSDRGTKVNNYDEEKIRKLLSYVFRIYFLVQP